MGREHLEAVSPEVGWAGRVNRLQETGQIHAQRDLQMTSGTRMGGPCSHHTHVPGSSPGRGVNLGG